MQYKQSSKGIAQIARELGVTYVLEGSVRRDGEVVRISAALIRASDQTGLWTDVYDRDLRDIIKLQAEVAQSVAREIALKVSSAERARMARSSSVNPSGFSAYLRGRYLWNRRTPDSIHKASECFQEAIAHDPAYAPAHAGIADCYALLTSIHLGVLPPIEGMPRAIAAAQKALALDPDLAEAQASLGQARLWYEHDWPAARHCFERALELNPTYAPALQWHAAYLQTLDRADEALAELGRALEVDPLSLVIRSAVEATLYLERRYQQVIDESRKTLELDPTFVLTYFNLGRAFTQIGNHRQAIAVLKKACELSGDSPAMIMQLGYALRWRVRRRRPGRCSRRLRGSRAKGTCHRSTQPRSMPAFATRRWRSNGSRKRTTSAAIISFTCPKSRPRIRFVTHLNSLSWCRAQPLTRSPYIDAQKHFT
jgi:tetratricopeptide (TPR) repeat protein